MTTAERGAIAEAAIVLEATKLGIEVFKPVVEGRRTDLVFDLGPRLLRVQCKSAPKRQGALLVGCYSCRRTRDGILRRTYSASEVDMIAVYSPDTARCYALPPSLFDGRTYVHLRVSPARNNQKAAVHHAHEFEFESLDWSEFLGP